MKRLGLARRGVLPETIAMVVPAHRDAQTPAKIARAQRNPNPWVAWLALVTLTVLVLALPAPVRAETEATDGATDAMATDLRRLRRELTTIVEHSRIPGVGVALIRDGRVVMAEGFGLADRSSGASISGDSQFRVASISKSTVALAALRLAERGEIDLNRPLREYVPGPPLTNRWAEESPVTLAHALEHSAGFDDYRFNEIGHSGIAEDTPVTAGLAVNPNSRRSRWRPGSGYAYSNPGTSVAARALEAATGRDFDEIMQTEVFGPLGMRGAAFVRTDGNRTKLVQGYRSDGQTPVPYITNPHRPAGNLIASPKALASMVQMLLARGKSTQSGQRFLKPSSITRMERSETRGHQIPEVAYGLANAGDPSLPVVSRGHNGGKPGFASEYRYFPELGVGFVLLFNSSSPGRVQSKIRRRVFAALTRGMTLPTPPTYEPSDSELAAVVGAYDYLTPRHEILRIFQELRLVKYVRRTTEGGLEICQRHGSCLALIPSGRYQFRARGLATTVIRFYPGDDRLLIGNSSYARRPTWVIRGRALLLTASERLISIGPILFAVALLLALVHRDDHELRAGLPLLRLPVAACLSYWLLPRCWAAAIEAGCLGRVHPLTVGFCALSLGCATLSGLALAYSARQLRLPSRPLWAQLLAVLLSSACFVMCVWLADGRIIGLRSWAW